MGLDMQTTAPSYPASLTSRLVPLPMMSVAAPAARSMRMACAAPAAEPGSSMSAAGPPMRNEQCSLMGSFSRISSPGTAERSSAAIAL